jgi:mono/diheme cytochrome c family protein
LPGNLFGQGRVTSEQSRELRRIETGIERAGRLFQGKKADQAAEMLNGLVTDFAKLLEDAEPPLIIAATPLHKKLVEARSVLVEAGQTVTTVADLPELPVDGRQLVFSRDIAPILVQNCGRCHIDQQRGMFSLATVNALSEGLGGAPVIIPGKPEESQLIELVEDGTMPPGDARLSDTDVEKLKKWIANGAVVDIQDTAMNLRQVAAENGAQPMAAEGGAGATPGYELATGNETVSFALDVAPILVQNCGGCHFEAQNVRGGLSIDNFRQLLRGGDGGPIVKSGNSAASSLIQRLKATDDTRMPRQRRPLDADVIAKIAKWIDEGAKLDEDNPNMNLREFTELVKARKSSHEELLTARVAEGMKLWKKVMPEDPPTEVSENHFHVMGTASPDQLNAIAKLADEQAETLRALLGIDDDVPVVKGRISLFVYGSRYDFNEFGKMIVGRDMPESRRVHWDFDTVNAYIAVQLVEGELDEALPHFSQAISALAIASSSRDVPRWFSDGFGFMLAETLVNDRKVIGAWQASAAEVVGGLENPAAFIRPGFGEDRAALAGYAFLRTLMPGKGDLRKMYKALTKANSFEEAFVEAFGRSPGDILDGNAPGNGNRRGSGKKR